MCAGEDVEKLLVQSWWGGKTAQLLWQSGDPSGN